MARIQAGSTLVNQYAPPFVVSDSVTQGWELVWSDTLQAFEAVDPSANVVEAGFDEINVQIYENVTQQTFVAPFATDSKQSVIITIDGVKQQQDAYSWSSDTASNTTTVTLADTVSNETVEILGLQTIGGATVELYGPQPIDSNVAGTVNAYFDLNWFAPSAESLIVTVDGIKQATNNYNITPTPGSNFTNTRLTFPDRTITFDTSTGVNGTTEVITTDTAHGFEDGDGVYYGTDGGVASIGLTNGTLYYVNVLSAFTISLHLTRQNAIDDAFRVDLTSGGGETHALTLITDPYLYINDDTDSLATGGTGYSESDVLTVQGGSPVIEAQIRVDTVDTEAQFTFNTDGAGTVTAITIVDGGTGYPVSGGGTFNLTVASDSGYVAGTLALITYTTDGAGVIDSAVVTNAGSGYTINLTGQAASVVDTPDPTLGAITAYTFLHLGEYVAFPSSPVSVLGGTGTGATFNVVAVSPQLEVIGITTTGETPASPVNATNIGSPDDTTRFGLYDSKSVSGETQILNFKSLAEGNNITMTVAGDTVAIAANNPVFAETGTGGGTSLFDNNTIDQDAPTFRRLLSGDRIVFSVAGADNPIDIAYDHAYLTSAAATITLTTERLVHVTPAGATTVELPDPTDASVVDGDTFIIKDGNGTAGTNNITITTPLSGQIQARSNGALGASHVISNNFGYVTLYSNGTNYYVISEA